MAGAPVHRNSFDAIRLAAAILVLLSHQFSLMGLSQPFEIVGRTWGEVSVDVFFVISGYLILQSWLADPQLFRFALKRFLRLYPAFVVVLLLCVLLLGPSLTIMPVASYFSDSATWHYLLQNLRMHIEFDLPGVFATNPLPHAVNGSLWTLPYEIRWYLFLAVFGVFRLLRYRTLIGALWLAMFFHYFFQYDLDAKLAHGGDHLWAEEFGIYFVAGMLLHSTRSWWRSKPWWLLALCLFAGTALQLSGRPNAMLALVVPVVALLLGRLRSPILSKATSLGDLSYGIYIYAFPVQQTIISLTGGQWGIWLSSAASLIVTVALAYVSWHVVEKRALRLKRFASRPGHKAA